MFAVLKTGGKQYKVAAGDMIRVEKLAANAGETVQFNDILMVGDTVGAPFVDDAGVQAEVVDQIKGEKVIHFVKRRRKHSSKRTKGHRQQMTLLRVTEILPKGANKSGVKVAAGAGSIPRAAEAAPKKAKAGNIAKADAPKKAEAPAKAGKPAAAVKTQAQKDKPSESKGADDLKQLTGVGPALEKKLHAAGITAFSQIADWSEADIAKIDEELDLKGRIERDGWVKQAKAMAGN